MMLVSFPPTVTSGYSIIRSGEGSEIITEDDILTGDVEVVVTDVRSGNYSLTPDGLQLKVVMTPQQALEVWPILFVLTRIIYALGIFV